MLCSFIRLNNSPVITVRNDVIRPSSSRTHLLCVPGWQTSASAPTMACPTAPNICTSSPRITSAAGPLAYDTPGMIAIHPGSAQRRLSAISLRPAGQGT